MKFKELLNNDKAINTIIYALLAIGVICLIVVLIRVFNKRMETSTVGNTDCVKAQAQVTMTDDYMADLYKKDDKVTYLSNYYNCNEVQKDELVAYQFAEQIPPVVRWVRGIPGDKYSLIESKTNKGEWAIAINGTELVVAGKPYIIKSNTVPPLKTYELSRKGILLQDEYLLFANQSPSISDSSNLGLVRKKQLVGKVAKY